MFEKSVVKAFSIVAMVLSVIGLVLSLVVALRITGNFVIAMLSVTSWVILLWASYIGFRLSTYKLYEDEYKKVGIRIYLIILAFVLFFFIGVTIGLVLSVVLLGALWALKSNYDDWDNSDTPLVPEDTPANP